MATVVFKIDTKGRVMFLSTPVTKAMFPEATDTRRASHVVPMAFLLRQVFKALRTACGDESRAANWTRRWHCLWMVDLRPVGGGIMYNFTNRAQAIAWEVKWLNKFLLHAL